MAKVYHDKLCRRCKNIKDCVVIPSGKYVGDFLCLDCVNEIWDFIMTEPEEEKRFAEQEYSAWLGGKEISNESKKLINIHIGKVFVKGYTAIFGGSNEEKATDWCGEWVWLPKKED